MTEQYPDIEIYVKRPTVEALTAWLEQHFEIVSSDARGDAVTCALAWKGAPLTCVIVQNAVKGGYASIWFKTSNTPWAADRECAREAFDVLGLETRCSRGSWQEGDEDEKSWLRFSDKGESVVNWLH